MGNDAHHAAGLLKVLQVANGEVQRFEGAKTFVDEDRVEPDAAGIGLHDVRQARASASKARKDSPPDNVFTAASTWRRDRPVRRGIRIRPPRQKFRGLRLECSREA